jgi:hypothetical protein
MAWRQIRPEARRVARVAGASWWIGESGCFLAGFGVSLLCKLVSSPRVLKRLARVLVSGLVVPFLVVHGGCAVSMRG